MEPSKSEILDHMAAIGNICWRWSGLEYSVSAMIWQILGLQPDTGKIVTGGMDLQPRLNVAIGLATQMKMPIYLTNELRRVRKEVQDGLDMIRNKAVHGVNLIPKRPDEFSVEMHRGKGPREPESLTTAELQNAVDQLHKLGEAMLSLHKKVASDPKFSERRAIALKIRAAAADTVSEAGS